VGGRVCVCLRQIFFSLFPRLLLVKVRLTRTSQCEIRLEISRTERDTLAASSDDLVNPLCFVMPGYCSTVLLIYFCLQRFYYHIISEELHYKS
jgi:hypothetical protein